MSPGIRYTDEFKREAVSQITDRGYSVKQVAERLGVLQRIYMTESITNWYSAE